MLSLHFDDHSVLTDTEKSASLCQARLQHKDGGRNFAGVNAIGNYIPHFYVFPGKRWMDELLEGTPTGSIGTMSDKGWSSSRVFETYVMEQLAKHAALSEGNDREATLIMYDGHKSHMSLTLTKWAKQRNVILFVLP